MPEADGVADLVDRVARPAPAAEADDLLPALPPDRGEAAALVGEEDEVGEVPGVGGGALGEADRRPRLPVRDGVAHALLVGQVGVDVERGLGSSANAVSTP